AEQVKVICGTHCAASQAKPAGRFRNGLHGRIMSVGGRAFKFCSMNRAVTMNLKVRERPHIHGYSFVLHAAISFVGVRRRWKSFAARKPVVDQIQGGGCDQATIAKKAKLCPKINVAAGLGGCRKLGRSIQKMG